MLRYVFCSIITYEFNQNLYNFRKGIMISEKSLFMNIIYIIVDDFNERLVSNQLTTF